jgi:methionyl-tRNA formyltransferase
MSPGMRAVVCAYGEVGAASLETLLELGVDVALVVTHEDAPGERLWFRSVRDLARGAGVRAIAPPNVNAPEALATVAEAAPDFLFSFYFRHMLKRPVLALAKRGALNLHGSLLPRYRGRAPVNWVLIEGETETGLTLHYMDEKPDHGDVVAQRAVAIARDDTALSLTRKLAGAARDLLRVAIPQLAAGTAQRLAQDHARSTYFGGRRPEDGAIDWRAPAERVRNLIRAVTDPWPGAFTSLRSRTLSIWWAETAPIDAPRPPGELFFDAGGAPCVAAGEGALALARVGWAGAPAEDAREWARRERICAGERCESPGAMKLPS